MGGMHALMAFRTRKSIRSWSRSCEVGSELWLPDGGSILPRIAAPIFPVSTTERGKPPSHEVSIGCWIVRSNDARRGASSGSSLGTD